MTRGTWFERGTIAATTALLLLGTLVAMTGSEEVGIRLAERPDGFVVISSVNAYSRSYEWGARAGMIVVSLNGQPLVQLPAYVYPAATPTLNPDTGGTPPAVPTGVSPTTPTPVQLPAGVLQPLIDGPLDSIDVISEPNLAAWSPDNGCCITTFGGETTNGVHESLAGVFVGFLLAFGAAWLLLTGRAGERLRSLGPPLALAVSAPLALVPLEATWSPPLVILAGILGPLASVPLALALIERIESPTERQLALVGSAWLAACAIVFGIGRISTPAFQYPDFLHWALSGGVAALPGLIAAGPLLPSRRAGTGAATGTSSGRLVRSSELMAVGVTPAFAFASTSTYIFPIGIWLAALAIAGRLTIRPLARIATRAQLQRDLVVAATEAERARVAANIHDDALQELTLLVRRLDAAGDNDGAEIARGVSDRLRAICGELRLPVLDDLGVGPALDWLVLRIERLAGGEVRLERQDGSRLPPDVELAFFRIAQEAMANAVKHGQPPIVIRYRSSADGASLAVDDAGPGIPPDAGDRAERDGHFGLLTMQQRAEAIGAILDIRRWPKGGTHVQLEWRAR